MIARFLALSPPDRRLALEALIWLPLARLLVVVFPFRWLVKGLALTPEEGAETSVAAEAVRGVGWAVARVARRMPFRAACLEQSLAALLMLRRRGLPVRLTLGVARQGEGLAAHAWVECGEHAVVGLATAPAFTPVARFRS